MLRSLPLLLLFCLFSPHISFAMHPLESPPISDRESLIYFVRDCIEDRLPEFIINYSHGFIANNDDLLYACNIPHIYSKVLKSTKKTSRVLYKITYYPGMLIADAYIKKDLSHLTAEQILLYNKAVDILNNTANMTDLEAELYFHDTICKNVTYFSNMNDKNMPRHATAVGALLDHKANCQGYCDAFYMLCTMYGFNVDMQSGIAAQQRHVWNLIEIKKRWYAVDVTWDDNDSKKNHGHEFNSHKYFNAPREIMRTTHLWNEEDETQEIEDTIDECYYYNSIDPKFGKYFSDTEHAIEYIITSLIKNKTHIRVMTVRDDKRYDNIKFINFQINRILSNARKRLAFYTISQKHGRYLYISVDVKEKEPPANSKKLQKIIQKLK